jgi:[acyl-carrier-protein] S-malonyltransferase
MKPFAMVFPGQGSQSVGMLGAWASHPEVQHTLQQASDALGEDLAALIANGPAEALALTTNTQPVMLAADVAIYRAWQASGGPEPAVLAGHSLGEYAAWVVAQSLNLSDAVRLVRLRAQAMQQAVPVGQGAMAAVLGLPAERVVQVCQAVQANMAAGQVVQAVNFNDPSQTVIAGSAEAVAQATQALKDAGAKRALPLPVSAPFHSSLMQPAAEALAEALAQLPVAPPRIPVVNNVDVAQVTEPAAIRDALVRQAAQPVRWVACVQAMAAQGVQVLAECGPGKVLTGFGKRIAPELVSLSLAQPAGMDELRENMQ